MNNLTLGSLFDGSGGFPLGGLMHGITPVWSSEVEPFPVIVTKTRFPEMLHLGDICKINGGEIPPVDIITFGSPCTNLSVAGRREGLDGKQSSLFYEAIRIIKEMRCATNGKYPRFIVWENVPGAFSSSASNDFRCVLEEIVKITGAPVPIPMPPNNKWLHAGEIRLDNSFSLAWRTLDAQFWGVAQRRRRIYLVADFRGQSAGKILFESESVFGDTSPCGEPGQGTTSDAEGGAAPPILSFEPGAMSRLGKKHLLDKTCTLRAHMGDNQVCIAIENHPNDSRVKINEDGIFQTLDARMGLGGGNVPLVMNERQYALTVGEDMANTLTGTDFKGTQCVFEPTAYGICSKDSNSMKSDNPHSGIYEADTARTIDANGGNPSCNQGGIAVVCLQGSMIGRKDENGPQGSGINEDVAFTLNSVDKHSVVYALDRASYNQGQNAQFDISVSDDGTAQTVVAKGPGAVASFYPQMKAESQCYREDGVSNTLVNGTNPGFQNGIVEPEYTVRRLTPLECCRLQGFPDYWCEGLAIEAPTEADLIFWRDVFETHRKILGTSTKPKTDKQITKWLQNPYSDSAEYKMWGNGVALPCVSFVMAGIVWITQNEVHTND